MNCLALLSSCLLAFQNTFYVPPAKEYKVSLEGYVSNSSDPCLTIPQLIKLTNVKLIDHHYDHFFFNHECKANISIHLKCQRILFSPYYIYFLVDIQHKHEYYDKYLDYIGDVKFTARCDNKIVENTIKLTQKERPPFEEKDFFKNCAGWNDKSNILILDFTNSSASSYIEIFKYKRYRIQFDYAVASGSNPNAEFIFFNERINYSPTYKSSTEENKLLYNKKWNISDKVIDTEDYEKLHIGFHIRNYNNEDDIVGLHIKNIIISQFFKSKTLP